MDKFMLCLANSYKHGGRCIAGIEMQRNENGRFSLVYDANKAPKWIRPISHTVAGEVPEREALNINIMSVVNIIDVQYAGSQSHSEDIYYNKLEPIGTNITKVEANLNCCLDNYHKNIFGNRGKALTPDCFKNGNYSVMLIKAECSEIYLDNRYDKPKERLKFTFCGASYDLPITDPIYLNKLKCNVHLNKSYETLYIVVSLGVEHDGWHSKLIASIIEPIVSEKPVPVEQKAEPVKSVAPSQETEKETERSQSDETTNTSTNCPPVEINEKIPPLFIDHKVLESLKSFEDNMKILDTLKMQPYEPKKKSDGCYIATAIYGSYNCKEVWVLRRFRDDTLRNSLIGRLFIKSYYAISPSIVKLFGDNKWFSFLFRKPLDMFVSYLKSKGVMDTPYND